MKKYIMLALLLTLGNQSECKTLPSFKRIFRIGGKGLTLSKDVTSVSFQNPKDKDYLTITQDTRIHITGKTITEPKEEFKQATLHSNDGSRIMKFKVINKSGSQVELKTQTTNSGSSSYSGPGSTAHAISIPVGEVAYVSPASWTVTVKSGPGKIVSQIDGNRKPYKGLKPSKTGIITVETTFTTYYKASKSSGGSSTNLDGSTPETAIPIVVNKPVIVDQTSFLSSTAKVISGPGKISPTQTNWGPGQELTASKPGIIRVTTTSTVYYNATAP